MTDQFHLSTKFYDLAASTAANIITYLEGDKCKQIIDNLRSEVANYAQYDEKFKLLNDITSRYIAESTASEKTNGEGHLSYKKYESLCKKYEREVDKIEVDASENKHFRNFNLQIDDLLSSYDEEQRDPNGTDDDMMVTGDINTICPITKVRMKDPMKNEFCGHVYDKSGIIGLINQNPKVRCPIVGCNNKEFLNMIHMIHIIETSTRLYGFIDLRNLSLAA